METRLYQLPHGIDLNCHCAGALGRPLLVFLHGFPEGAFVWDSLLEHFADPAHGGYRCVAPNLRGYEKSSSPDDVQSYRVKHLMQDIVELVRMEGGHMAALIAHDWGGAVAWNVANQMPGLMDKLVIINSPHPGTFLRELQSNPAQQAASAYMNFLIRPDAEELLAQDDYRRLWEFFGAMGAVDGPHAWLNEAEKHKYRALWSHGLRGGCNYYRASPLRPASATDPAAQGLSLPPSMLNILVPTLVLWGINDTALPAALVDGLDDYVPQLRLIRVPDASHWIVHERPTWVQSQLAEFLSTGGLTAV